MAKKGQANHLPAKEEKKESPLERRKRERREAAEKLMLEAKRRREEREPWLYCKGFYIRKVEALPIRGLDRSCYNDQSVRFVHEVWMDGKKLDALDTASAAEAYISYVQKHGYKRKTSLRCVADGVSLLTLARVAEGTKKVGRHD